MVLVFWNALGTLCIDLDLGYSILTQTFFKSTDGNNLHVTTQLQMPFFTYMVAGLHD